MLKSTFFALLIALVALPGLAHADASLDKAVQKTLKSLVGAVRYGKDDLAAKQLSFSLMSQGLLREEWSGLSAAERKEFEKNLEGLIRGISFPQGKELFKYLDAILYDPARREGERAKVKSTIVVHRDLKKTEMVIDWVLANVSGTWKVVDMVMVGESTVDALRKEQVLPLYQQGGIAKVLEAMRAKLQEVAKK